MRISKVVSVASLILLSCFLFSGLVFSQDNIKYPNVSGKFYPGDKDILSATIDSFFANIKLDSSLSNKDILALIVPHAGYPYSGQVAAYAFKAIKQIKFDAVIVLAPSHYYPFSGASVYKQGFFRTPLGDIPIDSEVSQRLILAYKKIRFLPQVFEREHSLEVELPFLQKALANFKLVPVIIGQIDYSDAREIAQAIVKSSQGKKVLVVASSDLSHYYPYAQAKQKDSLTISFIKDLDSFGLWQSNLKKQAELCGINPVLVLLNYARLLGLKPRVLKYANSGDVTGDKSAVVGYVSIAFFKDKQDFEPPAKNLEGEKEMFSQSQKKRLLQIARNTIREYVTQGKVPQIKEDDPQLNIKRGAFVTLHKKGNLRGCIGSFTSHEPIFKLVSQMAIESATADPRFSPVTKEELGDIDIEISVLTEPQLIDDWKKIRLGTDGVIVRRGFRSGVFLPQVATETGWDIETFLSHLCWSKAGLAADCYKDSRTQIYTFQAVVFSEKEQ